MKFFFRFIVLLFSLTGAAQKPTVKLYGYMQAVTGGLPPTSEPDEKGNSTRSKKSLRANYFVYLVYPKSQTIYPVELWIKGQGYQINVQPVKTPVEVIYYNGDFESETIILVPATENTCMQLLISNSLLKSTTVKKSLIENNEVAVLYKLKGRFYTKTLRKIKGLQTAALP
jgi:hypothetical protein